MAVLEMILRWSISLLLLATLAPAAPVTAPIAESTLPDSTTTILPAPAPSTTPAPAQNREEAELGSGSALLMSTTTPAALEPPSTAPMQSSNGATSTNTEIAAIVTTESPNGLFDCSAISSAEQAHAIASFKKGLSLVISNLSLVHLIDSPTTCPNYPLSRLNVAQHPTIHFPSQPGRQKVANAIGMINAYVELVSVILRQNPADRHMQALYDVLQGIVQDLYTVLSPTFCNCPDSHTCFTIPQLHSGIGLYYNRECSIVSYAASSVKFELLDIKAATKNWLKNRSVGPLPVVSGREWLDAHVQADSPAYQVL